MLFLVFNRASTTARVFESIRQARPRRLYVAADGPRASRAGEGARCDEVRRIATAVNWPCEVNTLFRAYNLGCKQGVAQGISWFFAHEQEGIILEDDVLPDPSFFGYCEALLERYRADGRVAAIAGCNQISDYYTAADSYFFTRQNHVWGWASWRRAWQHFEIDMTSWPEWDKAGGLQRLIEDPCAEHYWRQRFERVHQGQIDTWDYQWMYACWRSGGLTALPAHNLTTNLGLGFGMEATHTSKGVARFVRDNPARQAEWPLRHPACVLRNKEADRLIQRHVTGLTRLRCLKRAAHRALQRLVVRADK